MQGLWATPWLTDVDGLPQVAVTRHLLIIAIVQGIAAVLLGTAADRLRPRGVGPQVLLGLVATTFIAAQLALILRLPVPSYLPWSIVAAAGSGPILSYAILAEYFPKEITGRANGALNVFHFGAAFVIQYVIGVVVALWPGQDGHYPAIAYRLAFGFNLSLQAAALAWFALSRVQRPALMPLLASSHHAIGRAWVALGFVTPSLRQATGWDRHSSAHWQIACWRRAALASASLVALLGVTLAVSVVRASVTRQTLATAHLKDRLAILPEGAATEPSDAQIAYVLTRFIIHIRSLSIDPVVVRANWIDALDHVTAHVAHALDTYARSESPFTKIGRQIITVEGIEVMRVSADAFDVRWEEQIFEADVFVKREHFRGFFSIVFKCPIESKEISRNPFGVYIDRFTLRRDPIAAATR